jgi:hypothetical protein
MGTTLGFGLTQFLSPQSAPGISKSITKKALSNLPRACVFRAYLALSGRLNTQLSR